MLSHELPISIQRSNVICAFRAKHAVLDGRDTMRGNRKAFCVWLAAVSPIGAAIPSAAAAEDVRPLTSQLLPDEPGKALTAVLVTLGPGESAAPHRHGAAFVYAYVLKGRVRSQL